jgi:sporulation protein YlmC with PRC-barrel domain
MPAELRRSACALALAAMIAPALSAQTRVDTPVRTPASRAAVAAATASDVRMSKLIGIDVHSTAGEKLGDVKDVVVDSNSGKVHYAVMSFGGFLGVGDKLFAMPLSKVRLTDKGNLVLDTTKERLRAAPAFDGGRWPDWSVGAYRSELDRAYGPSTVDQDARFRRASELMKSQVRDAQGADIGDIKDIVVDLANSRVHYVVVSFDRAWNPNDKLVAVPMRALRAASTAPPPAKSADAASPPRNPPDTLALQTPGGPSKGPASATIGPAGVQTRPPAISPKDVQRIPEPAKQTMTSYADDEDLVYAGTRESLRDAPELDADRYPDLADPAQRRDFERRLAR